MVTEELLKTLKEYWAPLSAACLGVSWVGVLNYRVRQLEKKDAVVTVTACGRQQTDCQKAIALQFSAGNKEFREVKEMMADERKLNEERHNQLVTIIIGLKDHT